VIDALAAKANEKIDTALSNGKISEERAARAKERLQSAITRRVNEGHRKRR
jgi:ribosomal protein S20